MNRALLYVWIMALILSLLIACGAPPAKGSGIMVYTRSDACGAAEVWAKYLDNHKQEDLSGTAVNGDPGLAEAVRQDVLGIGYNNIGYAYDLATGKQVEGLIVLPIDLNENGTVDPDESFYGTKAEVTRAIANGKYPSPPARELYLVTRDQFTGLTRVFVRWILTDGQKFVDPMGYIVLPQDRIKAGLDRLGDMQAKMKMEGTITVSGAFALYPMMVRWSEEFNKLYPDVKFNISAGGAGKGMTDALGRMVDLGMVSREINPAEVEKGAAWIAVTKDAVVPVANAQNPFKSDLLKKGVKKQAFVDIWISGKTTDWKELVK